LTTTGGFFKKHFPGQRGASVLPRRRWLIALALTPLVPAASVWAQPAATTLREAIKASASAAGSSEAPVANGSASAAPPPLALANTYRKGVDLSLYWVSEKYDGVRVYWDGRQLLTRGGQRIAAPEWFTQGWPRVPLDGELWAGYGAFDLAQAAAARKKPVDDEWRKLRFMLLDMPAYGGVFDERLQALQAVARKAGSPHLQAAEQHKVGNDAQLQALLGRVEKAGGEGLVLHLASAPYRPGRSDDFLKLKSFEDAEARVVKHVYGKGKNRKRLASLQVETPDGKRFHLGTGLTEAQRKVPPPVGSWVTYRYRGTHPKSGLPRFASFLRVRPEGLPPGADEAKP
jgi:DNA ligase-1